MWLDLFSATLYNVVDLYRINGSLCKVSEVF